MENKEPRVSEGSVHSTSLSCSRALESDAECFQVTVSGQSDSTTGVSLTNSIEWHDQAYRQLQLLKEVYKKEYRMAHQYAVELQSCNAEERVVHEKSKNNFERMRGFLFMPKSLLSHYSKQEFFDELNLIIKFMTKVRQTSASATEGSQPSLTSQWLNTTTHHQLGGDNIHTSRQEDPRGRHIAGNQSQYQNEAYSYSESTPNNSNPKISSANVLQQSLTSGTPRTENKSDLTNVGILPNFNGQKTLQQEDVSQLPPLSWMGSLQRQMESATNSRMTHLTSDPNYQIMQPQMTMPHQFRSPFLSSSSALESNAGVLPTNSIEWQDQAYNQLIRVREKYRADLTRAYQGIEKLQLQPGSSLECYVREMFQELTAFLWMPKCCLAHHSMQHFYHKLSITMEYLNKISSQPSPTTRLLSKTTHGQLGGANIHKSKEDSRGRLVRGHQSQYQNVPPSYSEAGQITTTPKDSLTGNGATQSTFNNVLQRSLTSGPLSTENKSCLTNVGVLPNFNAQSNFQQASVSPLPSLSWMLSNCSSTRMQVNLFPREMESGTNLTLTSLPEIPTRILSQCQLMQPQMVMPHQVRRLAHNNLLNQHIGQNRQNYLSSQGILPNVPQDCTSLSATSHDSPQSINCTALPSATSTNVTGQHHATSIAPEPQYVNMTNTGGARNASHESDDLYASDVLRTAMVPYPIPATKRQKSEFAKFLRQEIELINGRLIKTMVKMIDRMTNDTHGTEGVILQFAYISVPDLDAPFVLPDLLLQVIVQSEYPYSSPVIVPSNPQPWSGDEHAKALWDKTFQKFDLALRTLRQPISVGQLANAWDSSAREACQEYAETLGGKSFGS